MEIAQRSEGTNILYVEQVSSLLTRFRKIIACAMLNQDFNSAREAYFSMPEEGKDSPLTKYLMFKVALQSGDEDLGIQNAPEVTGYAANKILKPPTAFQKYVRHRTKTISCFTAAYLKHNS